MDAGDARVHGNENSSVDGSFAEVHRFRQSRLLGSRSYRAECDDAGKVTDSACAGRLCNSRADYLGIL